MLAADAWIGNTKSILLHAIVESSRHARIYVHWSTWRHTVETDKTGTEMDMGAEEQRDGVAK